VPAAGACHVLLEGATESLSFHDAAVKRLSAALGWRHLVLMSSSGLCSHDWQHSVLCLWLSPEA